MKPPGHLIAFKANDLEARLFAVRWGRWRFENWHLYRLIVTGNSRYTRFKWKRLW